MLARFRTPEFIAATLAAFHLAFAFGADYPDKPIRIITAEAGGGTDFTARLIANKLSNALHQPVVIENRVALLAQQVAAKASPDGYALLVSTSSLWVAPVIRGTPYDPLAEFTPITLATSAPNVLVVSQSFPVRSVRELIDLAKARPGELNYAFGVIGSSSHLSGALFNYLAGVKLVGVAYKGGAAALIDVMGGRVPVMFPNGPSLMPHMNSGKLRPLAVTSARPTPLFPDLPTMASQGLRGYEVALEIAAFAPARTPAALVARLNSEIVKALEDPGTRKQLAAGGADVVASSPSALATAVRGEIVRIADVVRAGAIAPQ